MCELGSNWGIQGLNRAILHTISICIDILPCVWSIHGKETGAEWDTAMNWRGNACIHALVFGLYAFGISWWSIPM